MVRFAIEVSDAEGRSLHSSREFTNFLLMPLISATTEVDLTPIKERLEAKLHLQESLGNFSFVSQNDVPPVSPANEVSDLIHIVSL